MRIWSHDNFGEDLIINPRDSGIFYWDKSDGLTARAVNITDISGASNPPTIAKQVLVSDNDRHVIAFGVDAINIGEQDPLLIRFSSQESPTDWTPSSTNTAGDLRIGSGSEFVRAIETKREIVIFTDSSMHSMRFIGPPFTFGISPISTNTTIMGPNAAVAVDDAIFWMGRQNFYVYTGKTQQIPCTVRERVFFDFDFNQADKTYASVISEFSEVIWFYTSNTNSLANGGTGENDRYVIFNYAEKIWYYGDLSRTAFLDRGIREFPIAAANNYLFSHEVGYSDDGSVMTSRLESSAIDIGDGDRFSSIRRIIPDFTFNGSTTTDPKVDLTVKANDFPGSDFTQSDSKTVTRSSTATTVPFEQYTNKADVRVRGRAFAIKVDCNTQGVRWRLGNPRVDIRPDGRR